MMSGWGSDGPNTTHKHQTVENMKYTQSKTCTYTQGVDIHTHTHIHAHTHTCIHTCIHTHTNADTHVHTHMNARIHTHTHAHTHTLPIPTLSPLDRVPKEEVIMAGARGRVEGKDAVNI